MGAPPLQQSVADQDELVNAGLLPADEARERLLSFMVHEIRNPLASSIWSAEMLARKPLGDGRSDRLAQLSMRSVRRLRMLLEDLFALERIPAHPPPGQTNLCEAIERALAPRDLEQHGLKGNVTCSPDVTVPLDPVLLDRLLHACARRLSHVGSAPSPMEIWQQSSNGGVTLTFSRSGISAHELEPPPLTTGGSEGEGTTFTLMLARALARCLGVSLRVVPTQDGAAIVLGFPV